MTVALPNLDLVGKKEPPMKTVVALFADFEDARRAVQELDAAGVSRSDISVVAPQGHGRAVDVEALLDEPPAGEAAATGAGALIGAGFGLLAGLAAVTVPGVGIVAAAGPILTGGVLGA